MTKLYRPVGLKEMELILNTESKEFPKRLPSQPIFYPVLNFDYAKQIALKWNTTDINSGFVGYVTEFEVNDGYLSQYKAQNVGDSMHNELWIPAEDLNEFNDNIIGNIIIVEAFYGEDYIGISNETILGTKGLREQLVFLNQTLKDNEPAFRQEITSQWKLILLNLIYWHKMDFTYEGIDENNKAELLRKIYETLQQNRQLFIKYVF